LQRIFNFFVVNFICDGNIYIRKIVLKKLYQEILVSEVQEFRKKSEVQESNKSSTSILALD